MRFSSGKDFANQPHKAVTVFGMSGVGKSYQAERLALAGWAHHDCDAEIALRLSSLVTPQPGEAPVIALGRWMGMPYTDEHFARERAYLALEQQVTTDAVDAAERGADEQPIASGRKAQASPAVELGASVKADQPAPDWRAPYRACPRY